MELYKNLQFLENLYVALIHNLAVTYWFEYILK